LHGLGCPAEKRNPMQRLLVHVGNVPGNVRRKKKRFPSRLVLTKNHDALAGYRNVLKTPHLKIKAANHSCTLHGKAHVRPLENIVAPLGARYGPREKTTDADGNDRNQ